MIKCASEKGIEAIARKYGVPVEVVVAEIENGIDEAMNDPDPMVRENWKKMPWNGRRPTADEFIGYISQCLRKGKSPF